MSEDHKQTEQNNVSDIKDTTDEKKQVEIPKGMVKSGRVWKENQKKKSSLFTSDGKNLIRTPWELKQEKRLKEQRTKELQKSITEARIEAKRMKRKAIEERKERKAQNELKSSKVQLISDANKLKKMSKKQLRQIKKTRIDKNGNVMYVDAYAK